MSREHKPPSPAVESEFESLPPATKSPAGKFAFVLIFATLVIVVLLIGILLSATFVSGWPLGISVGLCIAYATFWKLSQIEARLTDILDELRNHR